MIKNKQPNQMEYTEFITEAHNYQEGKVCTVCNEHKSLSEFTKKTDTKDGLRSFCKSCAKEYDDNRCRFKRWFVNKKGRAKRNGIEFTLEPEDIPGVKIRRFKGEHPRWPKVWEVTEYPKVCPVFEMELDWKAKVNGGQNNSPSLDRIDSTKDYISGNVMIMSNLANKMKNNATPEQLKQFSEYPWERHFNYSNPNQVKLFG